MGELAPHSGRSLAYDWDHRFEDEQSSGSEVRGPTLVVIDDDGQPRPLEDRELDEQGLGHIVTTAATSIPSQRKPPAAETIISEHPQIDRSPHEQHKVVPDPSIYLG